MPDSTTIKIKSGVEALNDVLLNASTSFDIWYSLQNEANRALFEPVLDEFPVLFETTVVSHLIARTTLLYSVQESRHDTHNIPQLLKLARQLYPTDPALHQLDAFAKTLKPVWLKVSKIRNQVFGHRAIGVAPTHVFDKVELRPSELRSLIDGYQSFVTQFAKIVELPPPSFNLSATSENHRAMQLLRSGLAP